MNTTTQIVLFGWPVAAIMLFAVLPPRRAALVSLLAAWLFLPVAAVDLPGIEYNRTTAGSIGVLLGALLFDFRRFLILRPRWYDVPIVGLCLCAMASSLVNGLGFQDGVHECLYRLIQFGIPYLMGRMYFHDPKGLREVAVGIFVGGLLYAPLCLLEVRMSPQLHTWVYGYHQHDWSQTARFGGWRPVVFMSHGLEVSMWMAAATLSGLWLWVTGTMKRLLHVPMPALVLLLLVTTVLCKSIGAVVLLAAGAGALYLTQRPQTKALLIVLLMVPVLYIVSRTTGAWSGEQVVALARTFGEDRAESVEYRFLAENILVGHAMRQPVFGWGGWGRNRPATFYPDIPNLATDGLWVITLGSYGLVGLVSLLLTFLFPPMLLMWRLRTDLWSHPWCAPATILAVVMLLFMVDGLFNAMVNPFYLVAAGGLTRAVRAPARRRAARETAKPALAEGQLGIS